MRGRVSDYELDSVSSVEEAIKAMQAGAKPLAGGTDLMVLFDSGTLPPGKYVSLWGLEALRKIVVNDHSLIMGALTTYSDIRTHHHLQDEFPILVEAATETGGIAIQNRGTIGGNIANASPAADSPPGLMVYDATLILQGSTGQRRVAYSAFHSAYKIMDLQEDELIVAIELPRQQAKKQSHYFRKIGTRKAQAISKVVAAGLGTAKREGSSLESVRFVLGSVGPTVVRLLSVESLLLKAAPEDQIRKEVIAVIQPLDDIRSTKDYRLAVAANAAVEFSRQLRSDFP